MHLLVISFDNINPFIFNIVCINEDGIGNKRLVLSLDGILSLDDWCYWMAGVIGWLVSLDDFCAKAQMSFLTKVCIFCRALQYMIVQTKLVQQLRRRAKCAWNSISCLSPISLSCSWDEQRESRRDGNWVLGLVERGSTSRCFFIPLPNNKRDAATLIPIIQSFVRPGSIIMTDGWSAYSRLSRLGYYHFVVNHSIEYVNPITGAHINTMEGLWTHCKRHVNGNKYITDSLLNYMWRKRIGGTRGTSQMRNTWNSVFTCLKEVYGNWAIILIYYIV